MHPNTAANEKNVTPSLTPFVSSNFSPEEKYFNRDLSWLDFNSRVLELAADETVPLLERVKFLAIFASNLDEFFMVRVAGLKRRNESGLHFNSQDGLSTTQQLELIARDTQKLVLEQADIFLNSVHPKLIAQGINIIEWEEVTETDKIKLTEYFKNDVFPVLTPLAVDPAHPFPYISGLSLNLAISVVDKNSGEHFARIKVPDNVPRFIEIKKPITNSNTKIKYSYQLLPLEFLIAAHLDLLFPGMKVVAHNFFRVTRNADFEVNDDKDEDLLQALERELARRRFGVPVRLEVTTNISDRMLNLLINELDVDSYNVVKLPGILDLSSLFQIANLDFPNLKDKSFVPITNPDFSELGSGKTIFNTLSETDILVHHPYESFSTSVQRFIESAAEDPDVLAIKQTLYRTSGDSPIINALIKAAETGKQVVTLIELKARFDEENNITWARKLERAGVHVVYGLVGLKTHCKTCLVVRRENNKIRRYCHIGTGNYNPKTARLYEDLGLLTANPDIGADLTDLFNTLTGYSNKQNYRNILVAPHSIRSGIISRINQEVKLATAGKPARIQIKVNALVDETIIDALYFASQQGVKVDIIVRSICALKPGVKGMSENITVRSILGRFLEHSRIFHFQGQNEFWIGSADMMHRNLDRRVEVLTQVKNSKLTKNIKLIFDTALAASTKCWILQQDATWKKSPNTNISPVDHQMQLANYYLKANR